MTMPDRLRIWLRDANGRMGLSVINVLPATTGSQIAAGVALLEALTEGAVALVRRDTVLDGPNGDVGATGSYATARDACTAKLARDAAAGSIPVSWVAPKATIFLGDGSTLDPSNADVQAFVAWLQAHASDDAGGFLADFVSGNRWYFNAP